MSISSDYRDLLSDLSDEGTRMLVVGGYAVMHYTVPRYTKDLDIWIEPTKTNAKRVMRALARFGAPLARITADDLAQPGMVYQIGVEPVRADLLTSVPGLKFRSSHHRAESMTYGGIEVKVLCYEDVLKAKRAAGRPQDLLDIERLLQMRNNQ